MRLDSVTMPDNAGLWVAVLPVRKKCCQTVHLRGGEIVPANQTDAEAPLIGAFDMRPAPIFGTPCLTMTVAPDHVMIADTVPSKAQMHGLNVACPQRFIIRRVRAMYDKKRDGVTLKQAVDGLLLGTEISCHKVSPDPVSVADAPGATSRPADMGKVTPVVSG